MEDLKQAEQDSRDSQDGARSDQSADPGPGVGNAYHAIHEDQLSADEPAETELEEIAAEQRRDERESSQRTPV